MLTGNAIAQSTNPLLELPRYRPEEVAFSKEDILVAIRNARRENRRTFVRRIDILHDEATRDFTFDRLRANAENGLWLMAHVCGAIVIPHILGLVRLDGNMDSTVRMGERKLYHPSLPKGFALVAEVPILEGAERPTRGIHPEHSAIDAGIKAHNQKLDGLIGAIDAGIDQFQIVPAHTLNNLPEKLSIPPDQINPNENGNVIVLADIDWMQGTIHGRRDVTHSAPY